MTRSEAIKRLNTNKATLVREGYHHTCSVMDDCGTGGIFFSRPDGHKAVIRQGKIEYLEAEALDNVREQAAYDEDERPTLCPRCSGSGRRDFAAELKPCPICGGCGYIDGEDES